MRNQDWILLTKEIRREFSKSTWVPLRAARKVEVGEVKKIGYSIDFFGLGSVAIHQKYSEMVGDLTWSDIGLGHSTGPCSYEDGNYSTIYDFEIRDKEPVGTYLVLELPRPIVGGRTWILNPDLISALRIIKEGNSWVRPEENFIEVARESFAEDGGHCQIEIKREFLLDYLAARNMSLRISYYYQRVENVPSLEGSEYANLIERNETLEKGRYFLRKPELNQVFGGNWAMFRAWRTDVNEDEDAPVMGPENGENTDYESSFGHRGGLTGIRVEGEYWRDEVIESNGISTRVRGDKELNYPHFITETDGRQTSSPDLNDEDIGRWLWFRPQIINEMIKLRGFSLDWYTAQTGGVKSPSGYRVPFGVNDIDFITVYAYDIARLPTWEQRIWAAYNCVPEGKVSSELFLAQVRANPVNTIAVEEVFFRSLVRLERCFSHIYSTPLFSQNIDFVQARIKICRFASRDLSSLLRLAKEIIRAFSDRINVSGLRKISTHPDKDKLGSNKLLQDILSKKIGKELAREIFGPIVGTYDLRVGDAHPTSSKIEDALSLAGIDQSNSYLRQGEQLIGNFSNSIIQIIDSLSGKE